VSERPDSLDELAARVGLEPLLTIDEVAALAQVSRRTVERHIAERRVRVVHLSARAVRISRSSAAAYLEGEPAPVAEGVTVHLSDHLSKGGARDH
jgi:excisionase family DNA binding protein